jgi:hypothetical protein
MQDKKYRISSQRQSPSMTMKVNFRSSQNQIVTATVNEMMKANDGAVTKQRRVDVIQSNNVIPPVVQRNRKAEPPKRTYQ